MATTDWAWCSNMYAVSFDDTCNGHFAPKHAMVGNLTCAHCSERNKIRGRRRRCVTRQLLNDLHTPCVECGERRLNWLEFAHIDRKRKRYELTHRPSVRKILAELDNVHSLCVVCHSAGTLRENDELGINNSTSKHDPVYSFFLRQYGGRCQCGQPECDVQLDETTPLHVRRLIEQDHQPGFVKTAQVSRLKHANARRRTGPLMSRKLCLELRKCLPLFRPHHRIITDYRRRVDPMYRAGDLLPLEWRKLFVAPPLSSAQFLSTAPHSP